MGPVPVSGAVGVWLARRTRHYRVVAALLVGLAVGLVALTGLAIRTSAVLARVDPALASTPVIGDLEATRAVVLALLALCSSAVAAVGVPWLRRSRELLEALLGVSFDPHRPGPPGRRSIRRWGVLVRTVAPDRPAWWSPETVGGGRRGAVLAALSAVLGLPLLLAGLVLDALAGGAAHRRLASAVIASGAASTAVGAALGVPVLQALRRREVVALRNVAIETFPMPRSMPLLTIIAGLPLALAVALVASGADEAPCEVFGARCLELIVPADRDARDPRGPTMTVRFTVHPGSRDDVGLLVVAVGGPGASGIDEGSWRYGELDRRLRAAYDVVFFDPRGVGASGGRDCPEAAIGWEQAVAGDPDAARAFVDRCLRETGVPIAELPSYRTEQVVGDLEALRAHLGHERLVIYGESYGTELAQAYGSAHPERVQALVLDGAVDLGMTPHEFWLDAARGFGATLEATFEECADDPGCGVDLPAPELSYRSLIDRLEREPVVVNVPDGAGGEIRQTISRPTFEAVVASAMYDPVGRTVVLRALAEAARGEWGYVGRLAGDQATVWTSDGTSTFAYYAVTCGDEPVVSESGGSGEYLARAESAAIEDELLGAAYFSALPCASWPAPPDEGIPPLTDAPFPVLVLTATADPITRASAGRGIADRQPEGYLVETEGGAHVTFGGGDPCVDDVVVKLLVDGLQPPDRTHCPGYVTDGHMPLTPLDPEEFADPLEAAAAFDTELLAAPELYSWDGIEATTFGCRFGGGARIDWDGGRIRVTVFDCEWARGLALDGNGTIDPETWDVELRLVGPDTEVRYRGGVEGRSLEGTWNGREVSLRE